MAFQNAYTPVNWLEKHALQGNPVHGINIFDKRLTRLTGSVKLEKSPAYQDSSNGIIELRISSKEFRIMKFSYQFSSTANER